MARKKGNSRKNAFLNELAKEISLNDTSNDLASRCKFNFSYFVNSKEREL